MNAKGRPAIQRRHRVPRLIRELNLKRKGEVVVGSGLSPFGVILVMIAIFFVAGALNTNLSGMMPFITVDLLRIVLLAAFPILSLWLPKPLF